MSYHFHSSLYRITKAVRIQPCHFWVSKKRLSYFLAAFLKNHWIWPVCVYYWGGAVIVHQARLLSHVGGEGRARVPTSDPHTIKCTQVSLSPIHLSPFCWGSLFRLKELCRSDTSTKNNLNIISALCLVSIAYWRRGTLVRLYSHWVTIRCASPIFKPIDYKLSFTNRKRKYF